MSLFSALSVSASGMSAQRARTELLVENLANADTTRTPEGGPYRRKDAVFASDPTVGQFSAMFESQVNPSSSGVRVAQVVTDQRDPEMRYMPGHPDANKDGYVAYPRMNPAEDMVDLLSASRGYQANVAAISAVKDMINHSLDLFEIDNSESTIAMNISPIQPSSIQPIAPIEIGGAAPSTGGSEFSNILQGAIDQVEGASNNANQSVQQFLSGDGEDLHSTVLAVQRAGLEFDMLMQVRNKVVSAYQEVMRMQM